MKVEEIINAKKDNVLLYNLREYIVASKFFKKKRIKEIETNIDLIIDSLDKEELNDFFIFMYEYKELRKFFYVKHDLICKKIIEEESYFSYNLFLRYIGKMKFKKEEILELTSNYMGYFYKNLEIFILNDNSLNFGFKDLNDIRKYMTEYYESNKEQVVRNFILPTLKKHDDNFKKEDLDEINVYFFTKLLEEILKDEMLEFSDIKMLNTGAYCTVYQIGEKILKVGKLKEKFISPNSEFILQPFFRFELKNSIGEKIGIVELEEYVDTKEIRSAEVYELYSNLRDQGIIWNDAKSFNVGRLIKPNYSYYKGKMTKIDQRNNGLEENNKTELSRGKCVVLDIDYLYKEDEFNGKFMSLSEELENKYQEERVRVRKR
ncbi:MAG: hypothetical protein R3Y13_00840 [bacterium]